MAEFATQADVARALGLTQRTVSRVFACPEKVAKPTRERVQAEAERLGYRPHALARAMRRGRLGRVVLVQSHESAASSLPSPALSGILEVLEAEELDLGLTRLSDQVFGDEEAIPRAIAEIGCDGVFINFDTNVPPALAQALDRHAIPAVWLNTKRDHDAVRPDDRGLAEALVDHLHGQGHREIAYADLHLRHTHVCHYSRRDRLDGVRSAGRRLGMRVREWLPEESLASLDSGVHAAERLRAWPAVTAVIGYGRDEILAFQRGAGLIGRRWPEDLALALFADSAEHLGCPITTALLGPHDLGREAACRLIQRIASAGRSLPTLVLPPTLAIAPSTVSTRLI